MRFRKIYLEISNLCNLSCAFCPGTRREKRWMTEEEFAILLPKLRPYSDYLYFHLMGEPLLHPHLAAFFKLAEEARFRVIITTNGTLLNQQQELLLSSPAVHKINISLHAFEANDLSVLFSEYLDGCFSFGKAANGKKLVVYRLWNQGGAEEKNDAIVARMKTVFANDWRETRSGMRIAERTYLEYGDRFDWPDLQAEESDEVHFCYGLRDQIGVLCDGTVVPCCLDHEGDLALGNLFCENLQTILDTPRAKAIYHGFEKKQAVETLCRRCGYAKRFG